MLKIVGWFMVVIATVMYFSAYIPDFDHDMLLRATGLFVAAIAFKLYAMEIKK